ncbi:hypothetical protein [Halalkalibacter akibai]|uniref:Lipoprotein n=1 Tax=Halalkalibacter akibai (strain ATCC 43226 / DSM 21942 / CIP 109018 / JCM 9157 / 1139) TaxID=1236973 RepID=W4QNK9_HALA3|nr:hypothetical protein [Halalkalibacter akibai]GAE33671.1 hypothetical protein JCM9157_692 [Halalkalibacter akibai JCM 9157]
MKRSYYLILVLLLLLLASCTKAVPDTARGNGDYWDVNMKYSQDKIASSLFYHGGEKLVKVSYEIHYPSTIPIGEWGEFDVEEETHPLFSLGSTGTSLPPMDVLRRDLNQVTVDISWNTDKGKYKETIHIRTD